MRDAAATEGGLFGRLRDQTAKGPGAGDNARCLIASALAGLTIGLAPVAAPVALAQSVVPPEGCEAFLSIQHRDCTTSLYWRCEALPDGLVFEAVHDENGAISLSTYNHEFHWVEAYYFFSESWEKMVDGAEDAPSMTTLLETGEDAYAFSIREETPDGTAVTDYRGVDQLTGETVTVDGEELLKTTYAAVALDPETGEVLMSMSGQQFVMEGDRLFLSGLDTFEADGEEETVDGSPVMIRRPGEQGFGQTRPIYGCGETDIRWEVGQ